MTTRHAATLPGVRCCVHTAPGGWHWCVTSGELGTVHTGRSLSRDLAWAAVEDTLRAVLRRQRFRRESSLRSAPPRP